MSSTGPRIHNDINNNNTITKVKGEDVESVRVQSQLATSTVQGENKLTSNIDKVITDLNAIHGAHSGWVEEQTKVINERGQREIQQSLQQVKLLEEQLRKQTLGQQNKIEEDHKAKLARMVQELDAEKAAKLKELQDGLQRQLQSSLTTSQKDIALVETRMNNEKMQLLKEAQMRSAKEVAGISSLQVESGLKPSVTRTVIETQTVAGAVKAVASGGQISTGSASAETYSSGRIEAVPTAGQLKQETDVSVGDMVNRSTGQKVGTGAIVNTETTVTERPVAGGITSGTTHLPSGGIHSGSHLSSGSTSTGLGHGAAAGTTAGMSSHVPNTGAFAPKDPYGKIDNMKTSGDPAWQKNQLPVDTHNKHDATTDTHHKQGLLSKVKSALGGHSGEPKSTDATRHA